jgi:hypothetical protein
MSGHHGRCLEAIRKELSSLIIDNEVFEPGKWQDVPAQKQSKILLIFLKRKRDQHRKITKYKARLAMDGFRG